MRSQLALLFVLVSSCASAQEGQFLLPLERSPGVLKGAAADDARQAFVELQQTAMQFQTQLQGSGSVPKEYAESASKSAKEIDQIIQNGYVTEANVADLRAMRKDLELKMSANYQFRTTVNPFPKINVVAHTKSTSTEKSGYEVWWAYFSDRKNPNAYSKFRKDSSPALDELYPGMYVMYTEKNQTKGPQIQVGVDTTTIPYDFDLPIQ
jgi:hypothetical protein